MQSHPLSDEEARLRTFPTFHRLSRQEMVVAIVLWIVLTMYAISYSYARGKLSIPIGYSDSAYFLDGYTRLQQMYAKGLSGVAWGYIHATPHSPISSLLAFLGFALFGVNDVSPYLLNSAIAFVFLVYVLKFFRTSIPAFRWVVLAFVCAVPLSTVGITEFRPDFAASLFLALGVLTTISEAFVDARPAHLAMGGTFFGLSILSKPAFFPFALFLWGCSVAAAVLADFFSIAPEKNVRLAIRSAAIHGGALAAVALLDLAFDWRNVLASIRYILFSHHTKVWTANLRGNSLFKALYYLTGPGGKQMLGGQLWILLALIGIALLFLPQKSREAKIRWGALLVLTSISYAFFSFITAKTPFWGLSFQILMVFAAVAGLTTLLDWIAKTGLSSTAPCAVAATLAVSGLYFLQPMFPVRGLRGAPDTDFNWDAHERIIDIIAAQNDRSPIVVYLLAVGEVNGESLLWMCVKRGLNVKITGDPQSHKLEKHLKAMLAADVVVAPDPGTLAGTHPLLPSAQVTGEILRAVKDDPHFVQADQIAATDGKHLYVFVNNPFRGWTAESGMGPVEGPYPDAHLPRVRWTFGAETRMIPKGLKPGLITISGRAMSHISNQQMTLHAGQNLVGTVAFPEAHKFVEFTFSTTLKSASDPIILSCSTWDRADPKRPMAVLLESFVLSNTPQNSKPGELQ
jgi:hypothetical protein